MAKTLKKRLKTFATEFDANNLAVGKFFAPETVDTSLEEFEPMLEIDEDALAEAIQQQPDLLYRVGQVLALQLSRRDAAKQFLSNQEAIVDAQLRRAGLKSKERMTEKEVDAQKRINTHVVNATNQLLRMEHSVRQWANLKESVMSRGHALRELVNLSVQNYYAAPGAINVMRDRAMEDVRAHYKKKSRRKRDNAN